MKLTPVVLLGFLMVSGCGSEITPPVDGPSNIPFDLIYPPPAATAAYVGVSGFLLRTIEDFRDSVIFVSSSAFYAQFYAVPPTARPAKVELNGFELDQHLTTDTLRFGRVPDNSVFGLHTWRLTDTSAPVSYKVDPIQILDSVAPLYEFLPIRGDTILTLTWKRSVNPVDGILITWTAPGVDTYSRIIADGGRIQIPTADVARFAGVSELVMTRFKTESFVYLARPLSLLRVSQRNYKVTIDG